MKIEMTPYKTNPNLVGELLLDNINSRKRWGYFTDYIEEEGWRKSEVNIEEELTEATLCCGCFAKKEYERIEKYTNQKLMLDLYLYLNGDGTVVFKNWGEGWIIYNTDIMKMNKWEWVTPNCWVFNLPEGYYEA